MLRSKNIVIFLFALCASVLNMAAQETPPLPSAPKTVTVPAVAEKKLPNGLTIAVAERKSSPLVTIQLLIKAGAHFEAADKAGLANMTADMLTKGTKSRSATQIAEDVEFLGGEINSGAGWNSSFVSVTVTSDKVEQALAILADVVLNPSFDQKELDLLKSQTLDGLTYNLKQPSFLASYAASKYSFDEHPVDGTPASIQSITVADVSKYHADNYFADGNVLVVTGAIDLTRAVTAAEKNFGRMPRGRPVMELTRDRRSESAKVLAKRILVIDLPNSGQAAVGFNKRVAGITRSSGEFYPATVMNTVLGGGYSARLNYEIRIKRGLSYGAGSNLAWRMYGSNFGTRAQTKNQSAAEVAELTLAEIKKISEGTVAPDELVPRKSTLTGEFGMGLETTGGLAKALSDLYTFGIPASELNSFDSNVNAVTDAQIRDFASKNLLGGDIIIAGDYSVFKDDLAKRFPNMTIDVIKADDLDLSKDNLRR